MSGPTRAQIRAWSSRADTLLSKAGALLDDITRVTGPDAMVSDYADSVVERAEELADALAKMRRPTLQIHNPEHPHG